MECLMEYTHPMLVLKAARWLSDQGYCPVLSEFTSSITEIPDAIGWRDNKSCLVEVKSSRADFLAESRDKLFRRQPEAGVGKLRYFMAPSSVIGIEDLATPLLNLWGLLHFDGGEVKVVKKARAQRFNHEQEIAMLASALRRVHVRINPMTLKEFFRADSENAVRPLYVVKAGQRRPVIQLKVDSTATESGVMRETGVS
jgi:hypothetical protein